MANAAFTFSRHLRRLYCRFKRRGAPCGRAAIFFIYNSYCRFKRCARQTRPKVSVWLSQMLIKAEDAQHLPLFRMMQKSPVGLLNIPPSRNSRQSRMATLLLT